MKYTFEKVKLSRHQQANVNTRRGGHDISAADARAIMENYIEVEVQQDGRERFWGYVRGELYRVVVSATTTDGDFEVLGVERVVTAHRDRLPKK
jgi:hypothetical protein